MYTPKLTPTGWTVVKLLGNRKARRAGMYPTPTPETSTTLTLAQAQATASAMNRDELRGA